MPGGEQAGEDKESTDEIARRSAQVPRETEFHPVGEQGACGMGFEEVVVAPEGKRAAQAGVDEQAWAVDGFPTARPTQGERSLTHRDAKFLAGLRALSCADFQDVHPGRGNVPQIVRILMKKE